MGICIRYMSKLRMFIQLLNIFITQAKGEACLFNVIFDSFLFIFNPIRRRFPDIVCWSILCRGSTDSLNETMSSANLKWLIYSPFTRVSGWLLSGFRNTPSTQTVNNFGKMMSGCLAPFLTGTLHNFYISFKYVGAKNTAGSFSGKKKKKMSGVTQVLLRLASACVRIRTSACISVSIECWEP